MPRARTAAVGLLITIVTVGVFQQVRDSGSPSSDPAAINLTPAPGITEMGGSLRPVVETVNWRQGYRERAYHGSTYVAGVIRIYERVRGYPRPSPDERFAGTLIAERVKGYQIGYSAVAEAFLNFGTVGVLAFFLLLGFGVADNSWQGNPYAAARLGVVMYALVYQVRQASNVILTNRLRPTDGCRSPLPRAR